MHGVDDTPDGQEDVLPHRPDRGPRQRLAGLQAQLSGDVHRAAALSADSRLRGDAVARPHIRGSLPRERVKRQEGTHPPLLLHADAGDDKHAQQHAAVRQPRERIAGRERAHGKLAHVPTLSQTGGGLRRPAAQQLLRRGSAPSQKGNTRLRGAHREHRICRHVEEHEGAAHVLLKHEAARRCLPQEHSGMGGQWRTAHIQRTRRRPLPERTGMVEQGRQRIQGSVGASVRDDGHAAQCRGGNLHVWQGQGVRPAARPQGVCAGERR